jgi:hypothetical protein
MTLRHFGLQQLIPMPDDRFGPWWICSRKRVPQRRRKAFDSLVILVAWELWLERNDRTFSSRARTAMALAIHVSEQVELWCRASLIIRSQLLVE